MPKKVYELAKDLDMGAIDLVEKLKSLGLNVRNHMVTLQDDEVAKAIAEFAPKAPEPAKSTTKKKVAKKTTTKKKVVKKKEAATTAEAATPEVAAAEEGQEEAPVEAAPETKTVVVKKRAVKKPVKKVAKSDLEETATEQEEEVVDEFKEKMHSFTPVYIPEEVKKKQEEEKAQELLGEDEEEEEGSKKKSFARRPREEDEDLEEGGKDSKKRMGDLAAMVAKKGVAGKVKDVSIIRAEEEMKLASNIIGRQIYTPIKKKKVYMGDTKQTEITEVKESKRVINIHNVVTARDLAAKLSQKFEKFQNKALELNLLVKEDDYIGFKLTEEIAALYNYRVENKAFDEDKVIAKAEGEDKSKYPLRNPIITVMGHVDHGKTTLIDYIRKTKVTEGEAGGITQHIGAYSVNVDDATLTFLDTPGHAAFASMRQRGANVTDIVILVVAADDGVMPQTKESIRFAKNAGCPIIVAVNKMDKEGANPERIKQELTEFELVPEDWGGETMYVPISALKGEGIDNLLEAVKLQAEMMELRENPKGDAEGIIIESKIEQGRGAVATVLVQKGTLKKGDALVVGECYGRARSLMDHSGKSVNEAGPSIPVQILGLNGVPSPGDTLNVVKNEREAKKIVDNREFERKKLASVDKPKVASLEDFFASAGDTGEKKILKLVIRADVQGSFEAIKEALSNLGNDEVGVDIIAGGVGAITDNDVIMAANSGGYIIGFNMRPMTSARRLAEDKGVEVRTYSIIYELIQDVTLALEGMLEPETVEKYIGRAEVRETFNIPRVGTIAGSAVIDGKIERGCNIRLLRDGKIIHDGKLSTLKRFKDEVKEVANGYECGMAFESYNDVKVDDIIEAYILESKQRKLEAAQI